MGIHFSLLTNRHPFVDGLPEKASQESFFLSAFPILKTLVPEQGSLMRHQI